MIYFHLALLLHSLIISSLCNAMNESDCLSLVSSFSTKEKFSNENVLIRSFSAKENIRSVGFPTNNTVLTMNDGGWSLFCSKTGEQKINIKKEIDNFALSKDGKFAILNWDTLTVYNIETGDIIYTKGVPGGPKRIAFCSNNNTLGIYDCIQNSIIIHTIGTDEVEKYDIPFYMGIAPFAAHPTNKEFIIGNQIMKCVTGNQNVISTNMPGVVTNRFPSTYNPDGTVIAINQRKDGYLFHKRDSQVHEKDSQDFVINNNKNNDKSNRDEPYYSIAFHPVKRLTALLTHDDNREAPYDSIAFHSKKRFAALLTNDNNIEFWDYTKTTEKPLAIIELPNKNEQSRYYSLRAFAPDGKKLAVTSHNIVYIVSTPETAYYDKTTKEQCVAFNWAIKHNPNLHSFIPQDIVKLITHKLSRVSDFRLPKQIKPIEKKQQQNDNPMCTIS
jgi:WD40 repeat protein